MLETGSPPDDERLEARSVSPRSSHHASTSSTTPGTSSLDGTPRYLSAVAPSPSLTRSTPPPLDMAIKPRHPPDFGHHVKADHPPGEGPPTPHGPSEDNPMDLHAGQDALSLHFSSLSDISQLLRMEKYQRRKSRLVQRQLNHAHLVAARTSRLTHTARSVQRTLGECIKAEDKHSFANLFNAFNDALFECSELASGRNGLGESSNEHCVTYPPSFVDALSAGQRTTILDLVAKVRHDGDFVADRLSMLSHKELISLLPDKGQARSTDSVFGSSPRTSSRTSKHLGYVADGQTDLLSSLEYGSPLETLICAARRITAEPIHSDCATTDLWATVCARLITEQKPGSEKLVPAVIDIFASHSPWPGRERLMIWISDTLQTGAFILDQPNKQSFRLRAQGQQEPTPHDEQRVDTFFSDAVNSLLNLLTDSDSAGVIPHGALLLCQAICRKLEHSPKHKETFPNFVLTRWLFSSFLPDAITIPEIHGLLFDHFISDPARQRILRETASRTQRAVFDVVYSWKLGTTAPAAIIQLVRSVADLFQASSPDSAKSSTNDTQDLPSSQDGETFVAMTAADIYSIVNALFPQHRTTSFSSDRDPTHTGLQSSASSMSGFSLFQNPGSTEQLPSRSLSNWSGDTLSPSSSEAPFPKVTEAEVHNDHGNAPRLDTRHLREACSGIEDFLSSGSSSGSGSWCFLLADSNKTPLCTAREMLAKASETVISVDETFTKHLSGNNDYRTCKHAIEELLVDGNLALSHDLPAGGADRSELARLHSHILRAFQDRIKGLHETADFVAAHSWDRRLRKFQALTRQESNPSKLLCLLRDLIHCKRRSLGKALRVTESSDTSTRTVESLLDSFDKELRVRAETTTRLRDKMWYVSEVRTSAAYDEARSVASALRVMGKPKKPSRTRLAPPLRHWSASKGSNNTGFHLKSEAQVLEILSAPPDHGGPNKLSDDQSKVLSTWMDRQAVENFCCGEERLHRLCMDIRKTIDQLTAENSTTWSSILFAREKADVASQSRSNNASPFLSSQGMVSRLDLLTLRTNVPPSIDSISSASSHPLSTRSSRDHFESRSPTLTNKSSLPFWSPATTEAPSSSSATSIGSSQTHAAFNNVARQPGMVPKNSNANMKEELRKRVTSLLLSDLTVPIFSSGSETDAAFWTGLGGSLTERYLRGLRSSFAIAGCEVEPGQRFDFEGVFERLIHLFSASCNPFAKLAYLLDIDTLLSPYVSEEMPSSNLSRFDFESKLDSRQQLHRHGSSATVDMKVDGFRRLFSNRDSRPPAIFRDFQCIASLVPPSVLDSSPQGKAFWNASIAIVGLKQEARQIMVETADSIIAYHSNNRGHSRSSSSAQQERDSANFTAPSRTPSAEDIARYSMSDAAYLLQITAKEGDAVAQRELATLYLTHPELMDHIIAPFSRTREVFKEELESKWRKNQDPARCDPTTMCVAHHWMSLSSKGGDALAKEFLRQREEMDKLG